ncbi:unnamed protein product [Clavelina lepadiformis]|uniref:Uncharacterized protein n=1 Tax=Clavelina lepadiformis TaxID=159417 RepID=A0ABP0FR03_CLALP
MASAQNMHTSIVSDRTLRRHAAARAERHNIFFQQSDEERSDPVAVLQSNSTTESISAISTCTEFDLHLDLKIQILTMMPVTTGNQTNPNPKGKNCFYNIQHHHLLFQKCLTPRKEGIHYSRYCCYYK